VVYRKKWNAAAWVTLQTVSSPACVDALANDERGVAFEYLVGIKTAGRGESRPAASGRFIDFCRERKDSRGKTTMLGYMLKPAAVLGASRDERALNGAFAEELQWAAAGIENPDDKPVWGIDGYVVQVMNRNLDSAWHDIADIAKPPAQGIQSVHVSGADNLLMVLRDYRHYFRVRSYVLNDGNEKILSPEPAYTWSEGGENDYVKWGARQISADEFAAITALSIGMAFKMRTVEKPDTFGYDRKIVYNNLRPLFMSMSGELWGYSEAAWQSAFKWGAECAGNWGSISGSASRETTIAFTGPAGLAAGMYSGTVTIKDLASGSGAGPYRVNYNGARAAAENKHISKPFTFQDRDGSEYKDCGGLRWDPAKGWL
jgi:hypothetical protein